jgi:hypothetical protein
VLGRREGNGSFLLLNPGASRLTRAWGVCQALAWLALVAFQLCRFLPILRHHLFPDQWLLLGVAPILLYGCYVLTELFTSILPTLSSTREGRTEGPTQGNGVEHVQVHMPGEEAKRDLEGGIEQPPLPATANAQGGEGADTQVAHGAAKDKTGFWAWWEDGWHLLDISILVALEFAVRARAPPPTHYPD